MKGKKKYLLVVALLLLFGCGTFITYSIYRTSLTGNGTLSTAAWSVQVDKGSTTNVQNLNFGYSDITWTGGTNTITGKNDTIAPGSKGTITYTINATGSEVDVYYEVEVDDTNLPAGFTVTASPASGTIDYSTEANAMKQDIVFTVEWTGTTSDTPGKDATDIEASELTSPLSIPVTLTARQAL